MKPKWCMSFTIGLLLCLAVSFVESIVFNALGMLVGGTSTMMLFSVVIQYVPGIPAYGLFIAVAAGVIAGFFLGGVIKDAALTLIYSVVGGFFMGSCVSYLFWKYHLSAGDLWLENITSAAAGLDLANWCILLSLASMVLFALLGVMVQNKLVGAAAAPPKDGKAADEKTPLLKGDAAPAAPGPAPPADKMVGPGRYCSPRHRMPFLLIMLATS